MVTQKRFPPPDSLKPGDKAARDWIANPYSILFVSVILFFFIFGFAVLQGYQHFQTTRRNLLIANQTTANLLADLIQERNKATIRILQSYAQRNRFIDVVRKRDFAGVQEQLWELKKNAEIDLTFVTDPRGILWANFPVYPEAIGKDLSSRDWYKGVSFRWRPYISNVFQLIVEDKPLAVSICVPVFDQKERVIGILGTSQRLDFLKNATQNVPLDSSVTVTVTDRAGQILYSNKDEHRKSVAHYRFFPFVEKALQENRRQIEIGDPEKGHLTVAPMIEIGWTVILEESMKNIYRLEARRFIEIGATSILLYMLILFMLIYLRKASLLKKAQELLKAEEEKNLSQEKAKRLAEEMAMIAEIGRVVASTLDIDQVYERVAAEAHKLIAFDRLLVNRKVTPEGLFMAAYVSGIDNPGRRRGDFVPLRRLGDRCRHGYTHRHAHPAG